MSNAMAQATQKMNTKRFTCGHKQLAVASAFIDFSNETSAFHTKATSNTNIQLDINNILGLRQSDINIEPINEIFDEENKENRESNTTRNHHKIEKTRLLSLYKSNNQFYKISPCSQENIKCINKYVSQNSKLTTPQKRSEMETDYLFPIGESTPKRLEIPIDSFESNKIFSTTISMDPTTLDENIKNTKFPHKRKEHQCSCPDSEISSLK